jgi:hypothetical protein
MRKVVQEMPIAWSGWEASDEPGSVFVTDYVRAEVAPPATSAPRSGRSSRLPRSAHRARAVSTTRKVFLVLGVLAVGALAGGFALPAVTSDAAPVRPQRTSVDHVGAGTPTCAIYDPPTLESEAIPRSTLTPGSPYVLVCQDLTGREILNEPFLLRRGDCRIPGRQMSASCPRYPSGLGGT